jgi:hypothetical protein
MNAHRALRGPRSIILAALAAALSISFTIFPAQPAAAAAPLPDLEIPQFSLTTKIGPGEDTSYRFFVRNVGQIEAPVGVLVTFQAPTGFTIKSAFSTNGIPFQCSHTATLATCVSRSVMPTDQESIRLGIGASSFFFEMTGSQRVGLYKAIATVDPGNHVAESNENNNLLENAFRVGF